MRIGLGMVLAGVFAGCGPDSEHGAPVRATLADGQVMAGEVTTPVLRLQGGLGIDSLLGGLGDDTYILDSINDVVDETDGDGVDTVNVTLNAGQTWALADGFENLVLGGTAASNGIGNAANNTFTGNSAANTFTGGDGDDTYNVSAGDTVIEGSGVGSGTDTVRFTASYLREEYQRLGGLIAVYAESINRCRPAGITDAIWTVPVEFPRMVAFARRALFPYATSIQETRGSRKPL